MGNAPRSRLAPQSLLDGCRPVVFLVYASFLLRAAWNGIPVVVMRDGDPTLGPDAWTALCMALLWWSIVGLTQHMRRANLAETRSLARLGVPIGREHLDEFERGPTRGANRRALAFGLLDALLGMAFYTQVYRPEGHAVRLSTATVTSAWFFLMTAALLALEARIARAREWPLDMPTVFRFGLYLALPLGSWLGGAVVERILSLVMG